MQTLKDLCGVDCRCLDKDCCVCGDSLRQVAREWVENIEKEDVSPLLPFGEYDYISKTARIEWIKKFFNLEDD